MSDNEDDVYDDDGQGDEDYDEGDELDAELDAAEEEDLEKEEADIEAFGEEEELEEKEPEPDENPLNRDHLFGGQLSLLENVGPGLACAYVRLEVPKKELTDILMLENFIHLRYLDVSENFLTDISPVSVMTNLCSLDANKNRLASLHIEELPYLQKANFAHNKLVSMEGTSHPLLEELILEGNRIQRVSFPNLDRMYSLKILNLRGNKLTTLAYEFPPNLEELYVASNIITTLEGINVMSKLKKLHLRENQIETITSIEQQHVPSLTYLNLRGNNISEGKALKQLKDIITITDIVLQENPINEDDDYRERVIAVLGVRSSLKRLDKDEVDAGDLELATELMVEIEKEEADEKAAQEAAEAVQLEQEQQQSAEQQTSEQQQQGSPDNPNLPNENSAESEMKFSLNAGVIS